MWEDKKTKGASPPPPRNLTVIARETERIQARILSIQQLIEDASLRLGNSQGLPHGLALAPGAGLSHVKLKLREAPPRNLHTHLEQKDHTPSLLLTTSREEESASVHQQ